MGNWYSSGIHAILHLSVLLLTEVAGRSLFRHVLTFLGTWVLFLRIQRPEREGDHLRPTNAQTYNTWKF